MTQHINPCETARVRVLAAALVLQQCTKTACNIVPIPGKGQIIAIGTKADVARLLELAPAAATTQASTAQAEPTIPCCGDPECNACDHVPVKGAATSSTDAQAAAESVPADVRAALDRMCSPLRVSQFPGITAQEDERCMQVIKQHIEALAAQAAVTDVRAMPVLRNENGWWTHPAIPNFDEDHKAYRAWIASQGLEATYAQLGNDFDHPLYEPWFERGECNASSWEPQAPTGEGWFTLSIHDNEDGPVWVWARAIRSAGDTGGAA